MQQKAFEEIKEYMKCPPVLVPPQQGEPFKLYVSANDQTIGSALMQQFEEKERVVFYLSRRLLDPETRYSPIEKLCLACISPALSYDIIYYRLSVQLCLKLM